MTEAPVFDIDNVADELEVELDLGLIIDDEVQQELEELTLPDLRRYEANGPSETSPQLGRISFRHHRMAQLIALGYSQTKVAAMLGCTVSTVCRLCQDHAFRMLVDSELEKLQERDHSIQVKLAEVAEVGLDTLHDMLVAAEGLKPSVVKDITMEVLDRAGHGPSKQVSVTKNFGIEASTLERMKSNARPARRLLPAVEQAPTSKASDSEAEVGQLDRQSLSEAEAVEGEVGPGTCLPTQILPFSGEEE